MKTALIVDDSPLARTVLRKTLAENGLAVDEAASAEAAIEYLQLDQPDVIFLDHMMPGMDGFEALNVIKANPRTATIPVMMYTSQDGQLYVSQARALGAVDVIPKSLKPADVKRILRSHHLIEESKTGWGASRSIDKQEVVDLVRNLLREQREELLAEMRAQPARRDPEPVMAELPSTIRSRSAALLSFAGRAAAPAAVAALAAAVVFGSLYIHAERLLREANSRLRTLAVVSDLSMREASQVTEQLVAIDNELADIAALRQYRAQHYPFNAVPLDDARALEYGSLLAELKGKGYSGSVLVDVHEGRFCMNYTPEGSFELAPNSQPAFSCDRIGTPTETVSSTQQSVMFANMVAVATRDGDLSVETAFHGAAQPIVEYPALDYSVTAGEWNRIAAFNQRIAFRLAEDEPTVRDHRVVRLGQ